MRPLPALLLTLPLAAAVAAPLKVRVDSATYQGGPGHEPPPGTAPFEPRVQVQVTLQGLRPGTVPEFRLWRMPEAAAKVLRRGRPVGKGAGGQRIEGFTRPLGAGTYRILAPVGTAWVPGEQLVVDVLLRGRWAGRAAAPLLETDRPAARRPGPEAMKP